MSNLVRGGQITFHSLRMISQLIAPLSKWGLISWVLLSLILVLTHLPHTEYVYSQAYLKAKFYSLIKAPEEPITIDKRKMQAKHVLTSNKVKLHTAKALDVYKQSGLIAFSTVIVGWILTILYFYR